MTFMCPVCGYDQLEEAAYDGALASFEICPSCGTQFGYDDATRRHDELRKEWIESGCKWWFSAQRPPKDWNPATQLQRVREAEGKPK